MPFVNDSGPPSGGPFTGSSGGGTPPAPPGAPPGSTPPTIPGGSGPYNTPIPGAAQYSQLIALAQKMYQQSVATLNLQRQNTLSQYGYTGQIDPATGMVKNLGVDPNNPYGLYQQTLKGSGMQMEQAKSSFAGRGIRGGLENQGESNLQYQFGRDTTTLAKNLQSQMLQYQTQQEQAQYQEQTAIVQAQLQALGQAMAMLLSGQTIDPAQLGGIQLPQP